MSKPKKFLNTVPAQGGEEVSVLLYGDVGLGREVDSGRVVAELLDLQARYKRIAVRINSTGGDVFSGMAIYNALRTCGAEVSIYIDGVAASIAGIIALCGKPLYMSPYAKLMLHNVSGGAWGSAAELRETADMMERLEGDLAGMIAGRCGKSAEEVRRTYFDGRDHWIDAEEAKRMGLADDIYELDGGKPEGDTADDIYHYFNNRLRMQSQKKEDMGLIDEIKGIPSFQDKADEGAIVAHIRELSNKATKAAALEQANETYRQRIGELEAKEAEGILNQAVAEKRIGAEEKPAFLKLMNSDRKLAEELLAARKPGVQMRASEFVCPGGEPSGLENKSWDELDRTGRLADLKAANPTAFAAKYKEKFGVDYAV